MICFLFGGKGVMWGNWDIKVIECKHIFYYHHDLEVHNILLHCSLEYLILNAQLWHYAARYFYDAKLLFLLKDFLCLLYHTFFSHLKIIPAQRKQVALKSIQIPALNLECSCFIESVLLKGNCWQPHDYCKNQTIALLKDMWRQHPDQPIRTLTDVSAGSFQGTGAGRHLSCSGGNIQAWHVER